MRNVVVFVVAFGLSIGLAGCSGKVMGPYSGEVRAEAMIDNVVDGLKYSDQKRWSVEDKDAIALVKEDDGERKVNFEEVDFLKYCMLTENGVGQTCAISIEGRTETLEIDSVTFTPASAVGPGGAMIAIHGFTKQSKAFVNVMFKGVPYEGKK